MPAPNACFAFTFTQKKKKKIGVKKPLRVVGRKFEKAVDYLPKNPQRGPLAGSGDFLENVSYM